jgi:hypothetical protein
MESAAIVTDKVDDNLINELTGGNQVEQRIATNINHGVDATADKITEFRQDAHNLGQAAQDKAYGAAAAVQNAAASARDGVYSGLSATGQAIGNTVHNIKEGTNNALHGAENAIGTKLEQAGQAIKND